MLFQVTYIDFDFSSDSEFYGDVDPDYQKEITEETIGQIWEADDDEDLVDEITTATGWCVNAIDYRHVLSWIAMMTYKDLLNQLQNLAEDQLNSNVAVYDTGTDEYYQLNVEFVFTTSECDVLDVDHPVIRF